MRKVQIGIIGSCNDLQYSTKAKEFAQELGRLIAKTSNTLVFGAEKDINSLPTVAALEARKHNGNTIGITYEKGLDIFVPESATTVIASGLVRGGGRETVLMLSCDVVIALAGGSGTLNEICVAYQANIPVVIVPLFEGWSKRLAGTFLDTRNRYAFRSAFSPQEALELALLGVPIGPESSSNGSV